MLATSCIASSQHSACFRSTCSLTAPQLGGQRFCCSQCGRRFTRRSTSAFSGRAFADDIIVLAVRWYVRYRLSYAEVSEWLAERGVLVDPSTIYHWAQRFLPLFGEVARKYRDP